MSGPFDTTHLGLLASPAAAQITDIETLLEAMGAPVEALTVASAFLTGGQGDGYILAIGIDDADRALLTSAHVTMIWEQLPEPRQVAERIGDR